MEAVKPRSELHMYKNKKNPIIVCVNGESNPEWKSKQYRFLKILYFKMDIICKKEKCLEPKNDVTEETIDAFCASIHDSQNFSSFSRNVPTKA